LERIEQPRDFVPLGHMLHVALSLLVGSTDADKKRVTLV
jgi:hypothetical protein